MFALNDFKFSRSNIKGTDAVVPISTTIFYNRLNWNSWLISILWHLCFEPSKLETVRAKIVRLNQGWTNTNKNFKRIIELELKKL